VALFEGDPELKKQIKHIHRANGEQGIELRNGSRLRFVARTKGSGRGFTADLVILDEAYALTPEQMSALIPTLSSRPNPQIWYTSSPPLDGLSGAHLFALRAVR
jgi:phage terminase large subunit-like protein